MANVRGGVFTLRTLSRLKKDENWFALSDVWISPSPFYAPVPITGYFGGGRTSYPAGPTVATMDKVTYTTDTTVAVPGAALSAARYGLAATGNIEAGYFGGGNSPGGTSSTMDKIDYVTDTRLAAIPGANLISTNWHLAATGNLTAG